MMHLRYLAARLIRHFMPETLARYLLRKRWIIQPGLESSNPPAAAERYISALDGKGFKFSGCRALVFGYGGRFAVGMELLERGASHVVLCDHVKSLDHGRNLELLSKCGRYLIEQDGEIKPRPEFITLLHGDVRRMEIQQQIAKVDCVLSNSVYEHLNDVHGITHALARLTRPEGVHVHFVDLRDHYFKYPFEMLTYSDRVWKYFLNPTSHLNRLRMKDYRDIFRAAFDGVDVDVLERLETEFQAARARIRPAFLSGDPSIDSVSLIRVYAAQPKR